MPRRFGVDFSVLIVAVGVAVVAFATPVSPSQPASGLLPTPATPDPARVVSAPQGVVLQPVDGGADFYTSHGYSKAAPLDSSSFFPIGIWYPSLNNSGDVATYANLGINMLDRPDGSCHLGLLAGTGIYAIPQYGECGGPDGSGIGNESVGLFTDDEVDLNFGPGAGYTYLQDLINGDPTGLRAGRFLWTNYGTGVLLSETHADAAQFVNTYQQTVSADLYWFTAPRANVACAEFYGTGRCTNDEAQRGSNYGSLIDALRALESPARSEPIWAFVEDGYPFTRDSRFVTPAKMNWAVWSSIIHGARGIIYFNHSFGGRFKSNNNLENAHYVTTGIFAQVKATDALIKSLAPVLNDDTALNYVSASPASSTFGGVETMAKYHNGQFTIFTDTRDSGKKSKNINATFHIADLAATSVTVVDEHRSIPIVNGSFSDRFATGASVHIYQVNG